MPVDHASIRIRQRVRAFDFRGLFIEELGWDHHRTSTTVEADGNTWRLEPVASKRGFQVYRCPPAPDGSLPARTTRQKIDNRLAKNAFEHLIIFSDAAEQTQRWQWTLRLPDRPAQYREERFDRGESGERLAQKLAMLAIAFEDEEALTLTDVARRVANALRKDRVTKKFYDRFDKEREKFKDIIAGIGLPDDQAWYASIMLNRLMFVYFIQKKGFLNGDLDYLRNKLRAVQQRQGQDQFYSYYRSFLLELFHKGLAQKPPRPQAVQDLLGDVPYLNGGIFEQHDLEKKHANIQIPDSAFEQLFAFFDAYDWHLDDRPLHADNQINPDVLGYIFEKYINQKQMGAYYTKEDITEYISKNTIVPFLFDAARAECRIAFEPGSAVWGLLQDNPDRYIYEPVRRGVELPLPDEIQAGVDDVSRRTRWNEPAGDGYALPTETWREHVARRQRYQEARKRLAGGAVASIDELVTLNLDIRQFAQDVIQHCEGPELLRAFYKAIREVTVLDPTCGSGAFLFAALNVLAPLYDACLERMEEFVGDYRRSGNEREPKYVDEFEKYITEVDSRGRDYFIDKSVILNNLYGVDLMEEAVEICKLRLFLKLASRLNAESDDKRLPDIDFNIRAGNTLVGFTSMQELDDAAATSNGGQARYLEPAEQAHLREIGAQIEGVNGLLDTFRTQQTKHALSAEEYEQTLKPQIRQRLSELGEELDHYLARRYGITPEDAAETDAYEQRYDTWHDSHTPFHWCVDFYRIMRDGGFDVIIGNPPYVSAREIDYLKGAGPTARFSDIYAHVLLRCLQLVDKRGRCGMIVPLSLTFSEDFGYLRERLCAWGTAWFSSYDNIPAALFSGVSQRCTIWMGHGSREKVTYTAPMHRWRSVSRPYLLPTTAYTRLVGNAVETFGIPKIGDAGLMRAFNRTRRKEKPGPHFVPDSPMFRRKLLFAPSARNFMSAYLDPPPVLDATSLRSTTGKTPGALRVRSDDAALAALAVALGELCFFYWLVRGDGFDVTGWLLSGLEHSLNHLPDEHVVLLAQLGTLLHDRRYEALVFKKNAGKYVGNFNYRGMPELTRRADLVLMAGLGFDRRDALSVFDYVQRVLAINDQAGEKGIPAAVKAKFTPQPVDTERQCSIFQSADALIREHYGFTAEELDYIINDDIKYRMGRDGLAAGGAGGGDGDGEDAEGEGAG